MSKKSLYSLLCVVLKRSALRVRANTGNCVSMCMAVYVNELSEKGKSIGSKYVELYHVTEISKK